MLFVLAVFVGKSKEVNGNGNLGIIERHITLEEFIILCFLAEKCEKTVADLEGGVELSIVLLAQFAVGKISLHEGLCPFFGSAAGWVTTRQHCRGYESEKAEKSYQSKCVMSCLHFAGASCRIANR